MKRLLALAVAVVSGIYLLGFGWVPDPLPLIDEGLALVVFLNALAYLGLDLRALSGMRPAKKDKKGLTIDID